MSGDGFTLPAFAKVNLTLRVRGRRPDGYHEIETVFQTISLHDLITFELSASGRIELACSDPDIPSDETNLVYRAAVALRERYGVQQGARVTLEKRVPAQAGLGGGSSDAAVALLGLAHLWGVETNKDELKQLGARLGSDVPFFLEGGTALGTGTGAEIQPLRDAPATPLVVVTPAVKVSTAEGYAALKAPALTKEGSAANLSVSRAESLFAGSLREVMRNDFEGVVGRLHPEVERAREALEASGARRAMLSGSGSSVFGVFDSKGEAERAARVLGAEAAWRAQACATVTRGEYLGALGVCAGLLAASPSA
jgi:4-diphosphocytidyl-2-C-methyl-D-erythritol kinase